MRIPQGLRSALANQTGGGGGSSPPPTDEYFGDVGVLLYGDGTNGSTSIVDSSSNSHAITVNGDAQISTTQSKFGGSSLYFDGIGDYLEIAQDTSTDLAGSDFTIEAWIRPTSVSGIETIFGQWTGSSGPLLYLNNANLKFGSYVNGAGSFVTGSTTLSVDTWYHIAVVRSGSTINLFVDGQLDGSMSYTSSIYTHDTYVGRWRTYTNRDFNGYIDDFRITKGVARYTSNFTPPTASFSTVTPGEKYFYQNSLLLSADGSNGSTAIVDSSANAHTMTPAGNAQISTTQSKFGGSSLFLDGTGDYLLINSQMSTFEFSGDFTIEGWFWFNQSNVGYQGLLGSAVNADATGFVLITETTNHALHFYGSSNTSWNTILATTTVPTTNTWHHIAVCRSGSAVTMYLNGTSIGSTTSSNFIRSGSSLRVGGYQYFPGGERSFNGYIDDFRVTKGVARYTSNFTPPTAGFSTLTPAEPYFHNNSLLLHGDGTNGSTTFKDDSINNHTITANGNAQISTVQSKFGGASMYFDGSGDYLATPVSDTLSLGTSDFTIECWAWRLANAPANSVLLQMSNSADVYSALFGFAASGNFVVYLSSAGSSWDIANGQVLGSIDNETWVHYALTREGSTFRTFKNGVQQSTWTSSASIYQAGNQVRIGAGQSYASCNYGGYIDDLRITKGVARYTATFTPPTSALPSL